MDDRNPPSQSRRGLLSGRFNEQSEAGELEQVAPASIGNDNGANASTPSRQNNGTNSGGLLSRYSPPTQPIQEDAPPAKPPAGQASSLRGWRQLAGGARRLGENLRRHSSGAPKNLNAREAEDKRSPGARDWRATDFNTSEIEQWDRHGDMPFDMPPDPDAPRTPNKDEHLNRRDREDRQSEYRERDERDERDERREQGNRRKKRRTYDWDDVDREDAVESDWNAGSWDTAWATGEEEVPEPPRRRRKRRPDREQWNLVGDLRNALDDEALSESLNTLAQLGSVARPLSRVARLQLLMRRRPAAAAMLAFFLLGFMLTCCAPLIPLARLGYDTIDLARHVSHLQQLAAGGSAQLINGTKLSEAQADIAAINGDLYEINGAVTVVGAPIGAVSHSVRDDQLLVRIGYDLTGAANESIQVAQALLTPLEGGALSADSTTPGITPSDIQQARILLADAYARTLDAVNSYNQLDQSALPSQLKPGTKYGKMLAMLPLAQKVFAELKNLIDAVPALLGVGQPAYYLAIAMDSTELRPGGGFQGNYGVLELDGGKQSKSRPLRLKDTYTTLDTIYAQKFGDPAGTAGCDFQVTEPPNSAWWWPVRCVQQFGWGLRDANLSPDFPTNAQAAIQIAQGSGATPNGAPIQGVVAFTPGLIADILRATGPLAMPEYNVTVTADNLESTIHRQQLLVATAAGQDRKQFTSELASKLLERIKSLHGSGLKTIFSIAEQAIQSKDLQVYLSDPRAELILQQLSLGSSVNTGGGDGFFVVDTNDGGNKANLYVTESQTDLVTLLPNGGAFHRLQISVTYDKNGRDIFNPGSTFYDYSDVQRTYLPADATITGWSGFVPNQLYPNDCGGSGLTYATIITDCSPSHGIFGVTTSSDTPGRTMVMGPLLVLCGSSQQGDWGSFSNAQEKYDCGQPQVAHTQNIFISWYTPHAYTVGANGHGTYTELVEKQAGDQPQLSVYVTRGNLDGPQVVTDLGTFSSLIANAQKVFGGPLSKNELVSYSF